MVTALILGCGVPLLSQSLVPNVAIAGATNARPEGVFEDEEWQVTVIRQNNSYLYESYDLKSEKSIELSGAEVSGTSQRRIYIWNNEGAKHQVVWQARDPNFVRVKIADASGVIILNRLLRRSEQCGR